MVRVLFPAEAVLTKEVTAHKLSPAACNSPSGRGCWQAGMNVCIWVSKNESREMKGFKQKVSGSRPHLGWDRLGSAQQQLSWQVWLAGGHCSRQEWTGSCCCSSQWRCNQKRDSFPVSLFSHQTTICTWCTGESGRIVYSQSSLNHAVTLTTPGTI